MIVYGLTGADVRRIVSEVSADRYGGNIAPSAHDVLDTVRDESGPRSARVRFVIRARSSRGPGARRSTSGRRTIAASWQAHYDVLAALFAAGATRIVSSMADYRGPDGTSRVRSDGYSATDRGRLVDAGRYQSGADAFAALAVRTADVNVGSLFAPVAFGDL